MKSKHQATTAFGFALALMAVLSLCALPARADDSDAGSSVARISVLHGNVAMQRGDSGDTVAASINAPVSVGDYVSTTGADSRAEVQLDANDFVRLGSNSQVRFKQLDPSQETVQMAAGTIELRLLTYGVDPQVDTPSISIRPNVAGQYRISVDGAGNTTFTVRSGNADLLAPQGTRTIGAGLTVVVSGTSANPVIRPTAVVSYDGFDSWNAQRDQYAEQAYSDRFVNADVVGADDLGSYGHWVYVNDYGNVWVPYTVAPGWAPYHDGRWVWEPYYGWTWVGYEPWGWAPYHYGRWLYAAGYGWAWYPGPVYVRPVYRPALVAFFGYGSGGTRFNLAFGNVGWVPLAPYDPFRPWWGPGYANRTVVYNVTTINITRVYRNATVAGGVAVLSHTNFTDGSAYRYVGVHPEDLHSVSLVKNSMPVVPTRQNLAFTKVDAGHSVTAAPLSLRFQRFAAPAKLPPSFETQRSAIETATQSTHPGNASPGAGSSVWDRFNASRGAQVHGTIRTTDNALRSNTNDPWSKFSPANNAYTARTNGQSHGAGNPNARRGSTKQKQSGSKKPGSR